ncbi:MAG: hypothetical protein JWQ66_529 [Mucilaginibacter sp.]|nr:hypothetical protein [Mucilaginibacter sp.]
MNNEKDEDLDKLFRKGMEDPVNESAFRDADWDAMEQMLNNGKRRPAIIYWLPVIGSAAALLLIFLGYLLFRPEVVKPTKQDQMAVHRPNSNEHKVVPNDYTVTNHPNTLGSPGDRKKDNTGTRGGPGRQEADNSKQQTLTSAKHAENPALTGVGQKSKSFFTLSSGKGRRDTTGKGAKNISAKTGAEAMAVNGAVKNPQPGVIANQAVIAANHVPEKPKSDITNDTVQLGTADDKVQLGTADGKKDNPAANNPVLAVTPAPKIKKTGPQKIGARPQFAFGVLASSDLNGVNSAFQQSKVGSNFGAVFSVTFNKWTISTGGTYDIKPYLTGFDNYHTAHYFATQPSSVYANCRMLDIPLNVNYQVYSQSVNKLSLGTGLSSYFMLREDYKFNYAASYEAPNGPTSFTVINKNHNILSVLNLNATYTHQVNSKMDVTVQPYLKVPLSDVGASQVRLQSTGVALGLSWNLNTLSKPK